MTKRLNIFLKNQNIFRVNLNFPGENINEMSMKN